MLGKMIVVIVVLFLIALSAYLIHDSLPVRQMESLGSVFRRKVKDVRGSFDVMNTNAPVICVKPRGEMNYTKIPMTKKEMRIGRSSGCDIVLEDETVEGTHALVRKVIKENKVYYELVNLSRRNPAEYFNQKKSEYVYMGFKKGVVLDVNEIFYIGETKIIVNCPVQKHEITKTERMVISGKMERSDEEDPQEKKISAQDSTRVFVNRQEIDI